jgi:hypothetical protein
MSAEVVGLDVLLVDVGTYSNGRSDARGFGVGGDCISWR